MTKTERDKLQTAREKAQQDIKATQTRITADADKFYPHKASKRLLQLHRVAAVIAEKVDDDNTTTDLKTLQEYSRDLKALESRAGVAGAAQWARDGVENDCIASLNHLLSLKVIYSRL
jgi:hypothetical protein